MPLTVVHPCMKAWAAVEALMAMVSWQYHSSSISVVILHDFLLLGGDLRAVYPQGGLLVRPPLGLLHGLHVVPLGVQGSPS